jgi:dTDP-L-rhamnose 4-epimerase
LNAGRVLVTGAGGFIGRWSLEPLRRLGFEVCAVMSMRDVGADRPGGTEHARSTDSTDVLHADLTDARAIDAMLGAVRPTHLLHFAWIATPGVYWNSPENYRWLVASRYLLEAFQRAGGVRAVVAGSCAEYDWSKVGICEERSSPLVSVAASAPGLSAAGNAKGIGAESIGAEGIGAKGIGAKDIGAKDIGAEDWRVTAGSVTPYAACKIALEQALERIGRERGLSTAAGRIFFQYGPGEHRSRLVASVIVNLLSGREAPCTHGRQIRSFLHVEDVGAAFAALLASPVEGPVNIGSGHRSSIAELLERVAAQIGRPELLRLGAREPSPGEPPILIPDLKRLTAEVGFAPRWTLDEGLADTIRWWRAELGARP